MIRVTTTTSVLALLAFPAMGTGSHPYQGYPYNQGAAVRLYQFLQNNAEKRATITSAVYTYGSVCRPIGADLHDTLRIIMAPPIRLVDDKSLQTANDATDSDIKAKGRDRWCAEWSKFVEDFLYQGNRDTP